MKSFPFAWVAAFAAWALTACQTTGEPRIVEGIVYDASMNNVTVITASGDTVDISTMNSDPAKVPGVLLEDSVRVTCANEKVDGAEVLHAIELTVTAHSPYYYIQGTWVEPNPIDAGQVQGFKLNADGTAESVGMATLQFENWNLDGEQLVLGSKSIGNGVTIQSADTLTIDKIGTDSLVLSSSDGQVAWRLARQK